MAQISFFYNQFEVTMFEQRQEIQDLVDVLFNQCSKLRRGDLFSHASIGGVLGVDPYDGCWKRCIILLKRRMLQEKGISLWCEIRSGYRLCTEDDQIKLAHTYKVRARRRIKKGIAAIKCLPTKGLSFHQRVRCTFQMDSLKKLHGDLSSEIMRRHPIDRKSPTLPRVRPERVQGTLS